MTHSTITSKFQTTVPREVRKQLKLARNAVLEWRVDGGRAVVTPMTPDILSHAGIIRVGKGSVRSDISRARTIRARELAERVGR